MIIPARDEAASITPLLRALVEQTRAPDEIVVVDAGSRDETGARVREFARSTPLPVKLVSTGPAYPGVARNLGVDAASNEWVAFIDAGIEPAPDWLRSLCEPVEASQESVDVVYGSYEPIVSSWFEQCAALAYVSPPHPTPQGLSRGPAVPSSLMRKTVWAQAGGFPPFRASEDLLFLRSVARLNFRVAHAPGAVVRWKLAASPRATFRRFTTYSKHNLHAGMGRHWHAGTLRLYAGASVLFLLGVLDRRLWLLLAAAVLLRIGRTMVRQRTVFPFARLADPRRWVTVGMILLLIDLATFAGALLYLRERFGSGRTGVAVAVD